MAAVEITKVLTGLFDHLKSDSEWNTALGGTNTTAGRIWFNLADQDETLPYAVFSLVSSLASDSFPHDGYDLRVQIEVYESMENGPEVLLTHMDNLREHLHRHRFGVQSHDQIAAEEDIMRGPFTDGDAWRMDADYIIRGFRK